MKTVRPLLPFRVGLIVLLSQALSGLAITFTNDTYIATGDTTHDGAEIVIQNCTVTVDGPHSFASIRLASGGTLTHSHPAAGLNLTVAGNITIEPGGAINVNSKGSASPGTGSSSGNPASGSGGGHGGFGGIGSSNSVGGFAYGSAIEPSQKGSAGGAGAGGLGGHGGGAIRLAIGGTLYINGTISANGGNGLNTRSGGGSGGSIWIMAQGVTGAGAITANGGAGEPIHGGGGGGGRIAIYASTNTHTGVISARGGNGFVAGGAGTIYLKGSQSVGQMLVDNGGRAGAATALGATGFTTDLSIDGNAALLWLAIGVTLHDLFIGTNSSLIVTNPANTVAVISNAIVQAGGAIVANGAGYPSGQGPGAGKNTGGSGAGHGGFGGTGVGGITGGHAYGSLMFPVDRGSGGGNGSTLGNAGGAGGGALRLEIGGRLQLDGRISANGNSASSTNSGGGSGGSVWITTKTFSGSGIVTANGGNGTVPGGGGGGGGRIAIEFDTNAFVGVLSARGGTGTGTGGAGTIALTSKSLSATSVTVDNGGNAGAATPMNPPPGGTELEVSGGSTLLWPAGTMILKSLAVGANSSLLVTNRQSTTVLIISSNAAVHSGGAIVIDGTGYAGGQGPGGGRNMVNPANSGGSGAGYAGYGGMGTGGIPGGNAYGNLTSPTDLGSGGGNGSTLGNAGGAGAGALRLTITGMLQLDGRISANGIGASSTNSGGGSGGSIWINTGGFSGTGIVTANGGNGTAPGGGGGGGGRIAITYNTNTFSGAISAVGGNGFMAGGAGTVYLKANNQSPGQLFVDNGGRMGTNSTFGQYSTLTTDLFVRGGASLVWPWGSSLPNLRTLAIATNSSLVITSLFEQITLNISSNVIVEAGGKITALGTGYPGGQGPGAGKNASNPMITGGSGAGHGGYGAMGLGGIPGGTSYGSLTSPTTRGSGGGNGSITGNAGGTGGGMIRLQVGIRNTGVLHIDGLITANGANASGTNSGGGSGGGIWISTGRLSGSGVISANGGDGTAPGGGGGGGGRIAIDSSTNLFDGTISAYGGDGFAVGGAGTIYLRTNTQFARVLVDNGGRLGTNTTLGSTGSLPSHDVTVSRGGILTLAGTTGIRNLLLQSNGWLNPTSSAPLTVTGSAVVEADSGIVADGNGFGGGAGPGAGYSGGSSGSNKGGGGYGGFGGNNPPGHSGSSYGSLVTPENFGSGGGNGSGTSSTAPFGGAGGGVVRLNVLNALTLNGRVSANGMPGALNSGGGSGGSVWLTVGTLTGSGAISANGGAGGSLDGGGGGGGRVAIQFATNLFSGAISAHGGDGGTAGGAGTIYLKPNSYSTGQVFVDNDWRFGTNTPIPNFGTFDLFVSRGAIVHPSSPFLVLSNLVVGAGGSVVSATGQTNLELVVRSNLSLSFGGTIAADGRGFAQATGPGAGTNLNGLGSGGGHGGRGGASGSGAPGGLAYGWVTNPTERGSGGGLGSGPIYNGSQGGGAIRLHVGGAFTLNGWLNANGAPGVQDNAGGGAGGSIWITSQTLEGNGLITAQGGDGEFYGGGGGGGGRIALYYRTNHSHTNSFGGFISTLGGDGASWGSHGSILISSGEEPLLVSGHTPSGMFRSVLSHADIQFTAAVNPATLSGSDFALRRPDGGMQNATSVSLITPTLVRAAFPMQTAVGGYILRIGPEITDYYGKPMPQVYESALTLAWPIITGTVTDAAGLPVSGVTLHPSGGFASATTDAQGHYQLEFPFDMSFTVTPSLGNFQFVPGSRTYPGSLVSLTNQNYVMVASVAPTLSCRPVEGHWRLSWDGMAGVTYQLEYSTNLRDWFVYEGLLPGTNGTMELLMPINYEPVKFFRVRASH